MEDHEEVYGKDRSEQLRRLLREFAAQIEELDREGRLLADPPTLLRYLGDIRSELFHYEVRSTYDTPEVSRNRQIVEEARRASEQSFDEPEDEGPWPMRDPE
jgi:hypothetical protein